MCTVFFWFGRSLFVKVSLSKEKHVFHQDCSWLLANYDTRKTVPCHFLGNLGVQNASETLSNLKDLGVVVSFERNRMKTANPWYKKPIQFNIRMQPEFYASDPCNPMSGKSSGEGISHGSKGGLLIVSVEDSGARLEAKRWPFNPWVFMRLVHSSQCLAVYPTLYLIGRRE